jgi:DNA helicase-2/ATP-dependent DNA helicase PcrA
MNYIRMGIGYEGYLQEYADYRRINADNLIEVLDELQDDARAFVDYDAWFAHMEAYTKELQQQKKQQELSGDCVSLSTLHSAKGLEYPIVHILDVNEELMPYKKAVLDADLQEERRMFYVGITRARESLYIHSVKKYNGREVDVSRFVGEMQGEGPERGLYNAN